MALKTSHLIQHVADTDATIRFWCDGLGAKLESDGELAAAALDAMFERAGVRIRHTFINAGGTRIHTIETLDVARVFSKAGKEKYELGLGGLSFTAPDLEAARARAVSAGFAPTEIFEFTDIDTPVRMFFIEDPDGVRVEMIEASST